MAAPSTRNIIPLLPAAVAATTSLIWFMRPLYFNR